MGESLRMSTTSITAAEYEEKVVRSQVPVILDYGAAWCHPCKQLDPIIEELAAAWQGKAVFYKVDGDEELDLVTRFGVMGLPTLILFKHGEPVERLTGFTPRKKIEAVFGKHLQLP